MTQEPGHPTMSFGTAISTVFRRYADFTGWASRSEFWWFILFAALVSTAIGALNPPGGVSAIGSSLASVWAIATIVPTLAVTVRRLRDAGRQWTELFWLLLPIAGPIVLIVHLCATTKIYSARP
jgi:uncharacterized membrane protein YhaH (DUF805 family)